MSHVKALLVPDSHAPWIDPRAAMAVIKWAKQNKPDQIVHLGDLFDGYLLSRFAKAPELVDRRLIRKERKQGVDLLRALCDYSDRVTLVLGNHETRIFDRLAENPYLAWFFGESGGTAIPVPTGVRVTDSLRVGGTLVIHGFRSRGQAGAAALSLATHSSVASGHTHLLGVSFAGKRFGMECGYIARPNAPCFAYEPRARLGIANWRQGFGWLDEAGHPHVEAI